MDNSIIFILSDHTISEYVRVVLANNKINIKVYEVCGEDVLVLAREKIDNGTKIIISRGGTAEMLRNNLDIPIIDMKYTYYDFANPVEKALSYSDKIAVLGFPYLIERFDSYKNKTNYNIETITLNFSEQIHKDIEKELRDLKSKGIEIILGGYLAVDAAKKLGFKGIYLGVDIESILESIQDAEYNLRIEQEREKRYQSIESILNCVSDGLIATDSIGKITHINNHAKKILGITFNKKWHMKDISEFIQLENIMQRLEDSNEIINEVVKINSIYIGLNANAIHLEKEIIGFVITLQDIDKIQRLEQKIRKEIITKGHYAKRTFENIIGDSDSIKNTMKKAKKYARTESTILILGETGTGKELFAQSIHNYSNRSENPFVAINCAALPENILESELFGYVKGAFTGAKSEGKAGIFEIAHKGTIFLDEIGEVSLQMQSKLLRVLQEKEIVRIGDDKVINVDIRIIAASNKDLEAEVEEGNFREDLYYRLGVLILNLPPLRHRSNDIMLILENMLLNKNIETITQGAIDILKSHKWKGNIRELYNVAERINVLCDSNIVDEELVMEAINIKKISSRSKNNTVAQMEIDHIHSILRQVDGNKKEAAKLLGISTSTLWRKLKE
ncbi:MAG: sigma 54-interacting transcriptional regulator [Romboutsia sp.]|uniref:sigma 54-interacting transcriptional regulator n=1 Tax=Romboutsia sp. TaxID=1965302 RepID=UPI003F3E6DDF